MEKMAQIRYIIYINCLVCLSVEVLKFRSRLFVCRGPETQISVCPFVNVLKPRSRLFVCQGPETQIPTNILIHLSSNIFVLGTYWNLFWKYGDFFFFFGPENVVTLSLFFHKNYLYESYLIFCHKVAKKFTPKKEKKRKKNCCLMNSQTHHYGWMLHEMVVKVK
jgi:hypothetical protein